MPDIRHLITIDAAPDVLYPLVASPAGFTQWWAEDVTGPDSAGAVELGFFNRSTIYRLVPVELLTNRKARWSCTTGEEWEGTLIESLLEPIPTGTRLRFSHSGWREATDYFTSCNTTWGGLMFHLKGVAEGRSPGPLFSRGGLAY